MSDIYNRQVEYGGAYAADRAIITFAGFGQGLLVQGINLGYAQQMTRIWELGSRKTYYVVGRTAGQFSVAQIAGPADLANAFVQRYGDVCNASGNTIQFSYNTGWCENLASTSGGYVLHNAVINNMAAAVNVNDMMINESVSGMFNWMGR